MVIMAEPEVAVQEDLEDGEIESDEEAAEEQPVVVAAAEPVKEGVENLKQIDEIIVLSPETVKNDKTDSPKSKDKKSKKKSKEKTHKGERTHKSHKDKSVKYTLPTPVEDDFAGNIEKAIRKAMKAGNDNANEDNKIEVEISDSGGVEDVDSKRKSKKRKKHGQTDKDSSSKKRKKQRQSIDEMDEDEMMCVRGASPIRKQLPLSPHYENYRSEEDYDSESSEDSRDRGRSNRGRHMEKGRRGRDEKNHGKSRRQDVHPNQDPDGVCLFFMQGKCYKGDECTFSHDAHPPRKMELCKFYLMDCCAKKEKCLYLHSDFPCKYYHTGLPCVQKDDCKFAHGKPLTDSLKSVLLKHIELAPKEILGDFPRLSRDAAALMVAATQNKLMQQFGMKKDKDKSGIPSIFDLNVPKPANFDEIQSSNKEKRQKIRQSRWGDGGNNMQPFTSGAPDDILSIQNLNGVLTPNQISQLRQLGIENLNQLSQLTVIQLNQLGLTLAQINEIQLNTMSIQKLGLINPPSSVTAAPSLFGKVNKDLDMRVSPVLPDLGSKTSEMLVKDIDMRFQTNPLQDSDSRQSEGNVKRETDPRKQSQDNENLIKNDDSSIKKDDETVKTDIGSGNNASMDYDHRVLQYISDATIANVKLTAKDEDVQHEDVSEKNIEDTSKNVNVVMKHQNQFSHQRKDVRRMTTDDEDDNNLQIDEKWYSSDEDRHDRLDVVEQKIKSPPQQEPPKRKSPQPSSVTLNNNDLEATTVITKLGDLSKIDISAEVTKLLSTIKSNTQPEEKEVKKEDPRLRDPRNLKKSPEHKSSSSNSVPKKSSSKPAVVSIYNCLEGEVEDTRKKSDIDLRLINDIDFRLAKFGDTDLRQAATSSDVDLRLGLPFKSLPNYTPASEIDGSINSHPPIPFKLMEVQIPKPDYTEIKNSTSKTQAAQDPRLRKVFRLSLDENPLESGTTTADKKDKDSKPARIDPRKKLQQDNKEEKEKPKPAAFDLQAIIQTSDWYKDLSTNQKILVNQQLACVSASIKKFQQDSTPGKVFDLTEIHSNNLLTKIFANLGIIVNEKGEFAQVSLPDSSQNVMPQMGYMQNEGFNNANMNMMDNNMMNMGNMGNPMGNYGFQGNGQPGLLGMAPNMPNGYEGNYGNGMIGYNDNNFNNNYDNSNNMFNNGGDYIENYNDDKFYNNNRNNQKNDFNKPYQRGGRGGNDRWRGSRGRDRRGFTERGNGAGWKGDRRNNN